MIDRRQFIEKLGFVDDPFAHLDADEEVRLPEYFVRPPYFSEVFGDPDDPKSFFVFAPRGGGKTAQRIMMEQTCIENNVLAITYVDFDFLPCRRLSDITLEQHMRRVLAAGWLGIIASLYEDESIVASLSDATKSQIATRLNLYVCPLSMDEYDSALDSLKGRFEKFRDSHPTISGTVGFLLNSVWTRLFGISLPSIGIRSELPSESTLSTRRELELMIRVAKAFGYRSVYVLVDRIDESDITGNDAADSFALIRPIVRSLKTLQTPGLAFKFFLWDAIEPFFEGVGRRDRISSRSLRWTPEKLSELLNKRLMAHSEDRRWRLDQIGERLEPFSIDEIAIMFAQESPRDLILVCKKFVAEQEQLDVNSTLLSSKAVAIALDGVSIELLQDRISARHLGQLRQVGTRLNQVDFTVSHVVLSLKISTEASRAMIQKWKDAGAIVELSLVSNPDKAKGRRVKLYGVTDIRLARLMCSQLSAFQFIEKKVRKCHNANCACYVLRDWDEADSTTVCHVCFYDSDMFLHAPEKMASGEVDDAFLVDKQLHLFGRGK